MDDRPMITMTRQELENHIRWQKWQSICSLKDRDRARYWNRMLFLEQRLRW